MPISVLPWPMSPTSRLRGGLGDRSTRYDRIRGLSVLQLTPLQLVVTRERRADSCRRPDLKGRSVVVGPTGSGITVHGRPRPAGLRRPIRGGAHRGAAVQGGDESPAHWQGRRDVPECHLSGPERAGGHRRRRAPRDRSTVLRSTSFDANVPVFQLARIPAGTYANQPESSNTRLGPMR